MNLCRQHANVLDEGRAYILSSFQKSKMKSFTTGSTPAHTAAQLNDLPALKKALELKTDLANAKDENGWYVPYPTTVAKDCRT